MMKISKRGIRGKSILNEKIISIKEELKFMLIPKDESDEKNAIVEIEQELVERRQHFSPMIY